VYSIVSLNGQFGRNGLGQKFPLAWVQTGNLVIQIARLKVMNSLNCQKCLFEPTLVGLIDPNPVYQTVRLSVLYCVFIDKNHSTKNHFRYSGVLERVSIEKIT
jgi:hypothetical protein